MITQDTPILGVILAGGQHRRMGSTPKWQLALDNNDILSHVINRMTEQVDGLAINGQHPQLRHYGLPLIEDQVAGLGPLGGLLSALQFAIDNNYSWVATCPCDTPFLPMNWVSELQNQINKPYHKAASLSYQLQLQGTFGLWSTSLLTPLHDYLQKKEYAIHRWLKHLQHQAAVLEIVSDPSAFFNINTPEDLQQAKELLKKQSAH